MDGEENEHEMKEETQTESEASDGDSSEIEIVEDEDEELAVVVTTTTEPQNTRSRNSNRPTSSNSSLRAPVPEEIDNGPFVQFESSVGVHSDDLAEKLLNDAFDTPITILIAEENKQILKHGIILEQSPFFRHVLRNMKMKTVDLTEFDSSAVLLLIRYLYTGKLNISKSNVQKLLVTAEKFELIDVKRKCIQVIQDSLDSTNSFDVRKFAKSCGIPSLLKSADAFITKDLARLTSSQLFLDLGSDDILELLNSCPRGTMPSATEFSAILAWVQHDETIRESHLPQLMRNLSLDDLFDTAPELLEVPFGRDGILARNNECLFNYAEALKRRASKPQHSSGKRRRVQKFEETDTNFATAGTSANPTKSSVGVGTEDEDTYYSSEMSGRWEHRKDHPLFNHVILNILFEFMGRKDLKSCRLVCKKWCVSSLPSARSTFRIKLNGSREEMTRRVTDFVEVFRQNRLGIPFVKYNLRPFCATEGPGQEFLQICGNTAKTVYFWEEPHGGFKDMSALLKAMPNIEEFRTTRVHSKSGNAVKLFPDSSTKPTLTFLKKIFVLDRDPDKTSEQCPTFIEELLFVAPNISDIRVHDSRNDPDRSTIGQVLKAIEKLERSSVITNLNFFNAKIEHFESLRRLAEIGLKLKNLRFMLGLEGLVELLNGSVKYLPLLTTLFKNSIEGLCVNEDCSSFIQLPHMSKLEKLELYISKDFDSKCVNLNKLFPALKELELELYYHGSYDKDEYEWEEFLPNSEPCPNLKSLALTLGEIILKSPVFEHILNIFPKLTKFDLNIKTDDEEILRKILSQMTQLEDLSLNGNGTIEGIESIDALFTGIPVTKIQKLEHLVSELKEMPVQLREDTIRYYRDRYCHFPSIANLTNLKRLHLNITGGDDDDELEDAPTWVTRLTDVFVYFGLYSMKHINKLEIYNCEFTKSGCEILKREMGMGLESWTFQDKDDRDIIPQVQD